MKPKWTFDDFKDRAKYNLGDTVYTIESSFHDENYSPKDIYIQSHLITGLASSTLFSANPSICKIVYIVDHLDHEYLYEHSSYKTKEEALSGLKKTIEDMRSFYMEKYQKQTQDLQTKYAHWLVQLTEQMKLL
jgi:hypothetical protein